MNTQNIAKKLVGLRQARNWTQEKLSERLHISRQAISKWETGASIPDIEALLELSKLYRITVNEILEPAEYKQISDFEEIIGIDFQKLKSALSDFHPMELVKASMGASPEANSLLRKLFPEIDFDQERTTIGSVRITEIESIHNRMVEEINQRLTE